MHRIAAIILIVLLAGCAGKVTYTPPGEAGSIRNTRTVQMPDAQVWSNLVRGLSKKFFVINNMDKSSGLINLSYSGDPSKYVDCGQMNSFVENARGKRSYIFDAASRHEIYETLLNGTLLNWDRTVGLEGRMNVLLTPLTTGSTRVRVNVRYILQLHAVASTPMGQVVGNFSKTITFDTGSPGRGIEITCQSTGELEREVLDLAQ